MNVTVSNQENKRPCMYVSGISILPLSVTLDIWCWNCSGNAIIFVFHLAENRNSTKKVEHIKMEISSRKSKDRQYKKDQETNNEWFTRYDRKTYHWATQISLKSGVNSNTQYLVLAIVLSVLRCMVSDYHFYIFKLPYL